MKNITVRTGRRYRTKRALTHYDVIVVGSGMGGLTSAALLSRLGYKVCVLEQHYTAGGLTHSYEKKGYAWDTGVHYVGELQIKNSLINRIFNTVTDGSLQWEYQSDQDYVVLGDRVYPFIFGAQKHIDYLIQRFPNDVEAIHKYFTLVTKVGHQRTFFFFGRGLHPWLEKPFNALRSLFIPKESFIPSTQVLESLTHNKELIGYLLAPWSAYGAAPGDSPFVVHANIAYHAIEGGNYPHGGASSIARSIIPTIQRAGGEVFTYAKVDQIIVEKNRAKGVVMANGDKLYAKKIIAACGIKTMVHTLLPKAVIDQHHYDTLADSFQPSDSCYCIFAGFKGSDETLGLNKSNYWIYPSEHHDHNILSYQIGQTNTFSAVFITSPSAKDPVWKQKKPDHSVITMVATANYRDVDTWVDTLWGKRGKNYNKIKQEVSEQLFDMLYQYHPKLKGHLDYFEVSTPLTNKWFQNSIYGEIYGLKHDMNRFTHMPFHPKSKVKGLFLTGQDIMINGIAGTTAAAVLTTMVMISLRLDKVLKLTYLIWIKPFLWFSSKASTARTSTPRTDSIQET